MPWPRFYLWRLRTQGLPGAPYAPEVAAITAFGQLYFVLFLSSFSAVLHLCTSCTVHSAPPAQLPSLACVQCTPSLLTVADDLTSAAAPQLTAVPHSCSSRHSSQSPQSQSQSQSQPSPASQAGTVLPRTGIESVCLCRVGRPDCESQESHRLAASLPHRRPAHTGQGWAKGWLLARGWPGGGYWAGDGQEVGQGGATGQGMARAGQGLGRGLGHGQGVARHLASRYCSVPVLGVTEQYKIPNIFVFVYLLRFPFGLF